MQQYIKLQKEDLKMCMYGGNAARGALTVRELYKDYFNSEGRSVPWQFS